ncbi:DUF6685 family protein [Shewanella colwelliana]|uniref:DUF6685 family protein n=1 Tax=Shewanella colwelliana TaxID=23 RepID=UPI0022AF2D3F|nr:DUF6685 family protein [Shewanella colwelliana]MCZ4337718.1 hypothetical protein [Shewanella colwelliana]
MNLLNKYRQFIQKREENAIKQAVKDQFSNGNFFAKAPPMQSRTVTWDYGFNWQSMFAPAIEYPTGETNATVKVTQINCNPRLRDVLYSDWEMPLFNQAITTRFIDRYSINIREIDGLSSGKCIPSNFETLDDLALDRIDTLPKLPKDPEDALVEALKHQEIRLIHSTLSEPVIKMAWDNRSYLINNGGAHHFAVARYLAEKLGKSADLNYECRYFAECSLDAVAIREIQQAYNLVVVKQDAICEFTDFLNDYRGHCYRTNFLENYAQLYIFPRDNAQMNAIAEGLKEIGHLDMNKQLSELLELQDRHQLIRTDTAAKEVVTISQPRMGR